MELIRQKAVTLNINFHAYIICILMVAWNPQIFIFDWCEDFIMGISFLFAPPPLKINSEACSFQVLLHDSESTPCL